MPPPNAMRDLRIISIDGGPSGWLQARFLREFERRFPGFLDRTAMFAGVSAGALVGLHLAKNLRLGISHADALAAADRCVGFTNELVRAARVRLLSPRWVAALTGGRALQAPRTFERIFEAHFGPGATLGDLEREVCVVAWDLESGKQVTFHQYPRLGDAPDRSDQDRGLRVVDVALATSGFPVIMPIADSIHHGRIGTQCIDAGMLANNPSMTAINDALRNLCTDDPIVDRFRNDDETVEQLPYLQVLSLGVLERSRAQRDSLRVPKGRGMVRETLRPVLGGLPLVGGTLAEALRGMFDGPLDWGWRQWVLARPTFAAMLLLKGSVDSTERQSRQLLGPRYERFHPTCEQLAGLRDALLDPEKLIRDLDDRVEKLFDAYDAHRPADRLDDHPRHRRGEYGGPQCDVIDLCDTMRFIEEVWMDPAKDAQRAERRRLRALSEVGDEPELVEGRYRKRWLRA